jgi:imidazoleglycerol phosphate dehydratase HisB
MSTIFRETGETRVRIDLAPFAGAEDGSTRISTGEPFLDHMLVTLAR